MEAVLITVPGIPTPQGSMRGFVTKGGRVIVTSDNKALRPWRLDVTAAAVQRWGERPILLGGVCLRLAYFFPRPKGHFNSKRLLTPRAASIHTTRPDLDKLNRGIGDALKGAGVYKDDSQVYSCESAKFYVGVAGSESRPHMSIPGVRIEVWGA